MEQSVIRIQARLMKEYYKYFSKYAKGKLPEKKVAWVTAFTPVEILEALDMVYYYPESYAAVIAASNQEQLLLEKSEDICLSRDCCSYSCCIQGCLELEAGPRGVPPKPDILIATNNQCNTLPNWWNLIAEKYKVPLIVIDYPGENTCTDIAFDYVTKQHKALIATLEKLTGNKLCIDKLNELIQNSQNSVKEWLKVIKHLKCREVRPTSLFDDINFLITARCKADTSDMYRMMEEELKEKPMSDENLIPIYWLGYPLWYHEERYLSSLLKGCKIVGSNYITWWCLNYEGEDAYEKLFYAYNYTFLNLSQATRNERLKKSICESGAKGTITLHNKSCKCDFVSARDISIPQAELEIDMIDRTFLDVDSAQRKVALLKDMVCME